MLVVNNLTPTEKRIVQALSDGDNHTREELLKCLDDEMATDIAFYAHVQRLRTKLRNAGHDVVSVNVRGPKYRMVRLLAKDD